MPGLNEAVRQIALADRLIVNKVDTVDAATLAEVEAALRRVNVAAPVFKTSHSRYAPARRWRSRGCRSLIARTMLPYAGPDHRVDTTVVLGLQAFRDRVPETLREVEPATAAADAPHNHEHHHDHCGCQNHTHGDAHAEAAAHRVATATVVLPGRLDPMLLERWLGELLWENVRPPHVLAPYLPSSLNFAALAPILLPVTQCVPGDCRSMVIMRAKGEVAARDDPYRYVLQGPWSPQRMHTASSGASYLTTPLGFHLLCKLASGLRRV